MKQLTFTLDLEDHRPDESLPKRYPQITAQIMDFLAKRNIKATIFTVATLAQNDPQIIKDIHAAGHEIAHHSFDHTPLTRQTPQEFRDHTRRGKDILEDIIGEKITGYRAPIFSLTRKTLWAINILKELGFEYSSSILPAASPLHGLPGAPATPFRWSNGLLEIPAPIGHIGPLTTPYLGGFYLRYLPLALIKAQINKAPADSSLWAYCHPYDFDAQEKNWRIKHASIPVSLLLWLNRKNTFAKLEQILSHCEILPPFKNQNFDGVAKSLNPSTL